MDLALRAYGIRKSYTGSDGGRIPVLSLPHLEVARGEIVAVSGRSGSGKTTLLNIIAGLESPDSGELWALEHPVPALPETARDAFRARRIGYIYQALHLMPGLTALENVLLAATLAGAGAPTAAASRCVELLKRVGLGHRLHHRPAQLSTGEKQRVAIARSLVNAPPLLLADEPTASLDFQSAAGVVELLWEMWSEQGMTVIVATHDRDLMSRAGRVVELAPPAGGRLEHVGLADRLARPAHAGR